MSTRVVLKYGSLSVTLPTGIPIGRNMLDDSLQLDQSSSYHIVNELGVLVRLLGYTAVLFDSEGTYTVKASEELFGASRSSDSTADDVEHTPPAYNGQRSSAPPIRHFTRSMEEHSIRTGPPFSSRFDIFGGRPSSPLISRNQNRAPRNIPQNGVAPPFVRRGSPSNRGSFIRVLPARYVLVDRGGAGGGFRLEPIAHGALRMVQVPQNESSFTAQYVLGSLQSADSTFQADDHVLCLRTGHFIQPTDSVLAVTRSGRPGRTCDLYVARKPDESNSQSIVWSPVEVADEETQTEDFVDILEAEIVARSFCRVCRGEDSSVLCGQCRNPFCGPCYRAVKKVAVDVGRAEFEAEQRSRQMEAGQEEVQDDLEIFDPDSVPVFCPMCRDTFPLNPSLISIPRLA